MKENVLGLEIPMNDVIVVHELKGVTDLPDDGFDLSLSQYFLPSQVSVKISRKAQFQYQINMGLVREKCIKLHYVRMVQVKLNLNFPHQLNDHILVENLSVNNFERTYEFALDVFGHVHSSSFSLSDLCQNYKIFNWHRLDLSDRRFQWYFTSKMRHNLWNIVEGLNVFAWR